jgi:ribose 5-phosphate isomerase A
MPISRDPQIDELKRLAALRAVEYVRDGMVVGLGTGSTAKHAVQAIGKRVSEGLKIVGVPTSERTARLARELGITLTTLEEHPQVDVTIDGADEIQLSTLYAIKGLGGALLREKLVALATREQTLIVDGGKVVEKLGSHDPLPVEVVSFGWKRTRASLEALGCEPRLREGDNGDPFLTDSGNYLLDCRFPNGIDDPPSTASHIKSITGVVEHGLFIGIVHRVIVARAGGIEVVER